MPQADVIEGRCGCGACVHTTFVADPTVDPDTAVTMWLISPWWDDESKNSLFGARSLRCPNPDCHYDCGEDGFARRMVDATVEDVRARYIPLALAGRSLIAEELGISEAVYAEAKTAGRIVELKRLLPEEEADE